MADAQVQNDTENMSDSDLLKKLRRQELEKMLAKNQPEEGGLMDKENMQTLLLSALPILVGSAIGGKAGGAAGANAAKVGLDVQTQEKETQDKRDLERQKGIERAIALDEERTNKQQEFNLKRADLQTRQAEMQASKDTQLGMKKDQIAGTLRQQRDSLPTTRDTQQVLSAVQRIRESAKDPTAAGDLSLIFSYMKALDPGSVVREGEFANAQNAAGVPDQIKNMYNRIRSGERLNPAQRADFVSQSEKLAQAQLKQQKKIDDFYVQAAKKRGLDPEDVIIDFAGSDFAAPQAQASQKGPSNYSPFPQAQAQSERMNYGGVTYQKTARGWERVK